MADVDSEFWHGKRVFLTGHTGFKGGWLALWLADLGAQVTGYALAPNTTPSLFDTIGLADLVHRHVVGDVRDRDSLGVAMQDCQPDVVFHLAAQPLVRASYVSPVDTYATNVMGTLHVLEAVRNCESVRAVVGITTDKVYENREWHWGYRETDHLGGRDPYSSSKACAEIATASWRSSFLADSGVGVATARAGNVIGGGDWSDDRLVPDAARAFAEGRSVAIRSPQSTRPWQHVVEPLRGYLILAQACHADPGRFGGAYNFGPLAHAIVPVGEFIEGFARAWGNGASWKDVSSAEKGPHEARLLSLDISRAVAALSWNPELSLQQAIELTAEWYRAHAASADAGALQNLMRQQIARRAQ